jgi:hypothetical protein
MKTDERAARHPSLCSEPRDPHDSPQNALMIRPRVLEVCRVAHRALWPINKKEAGASVARKKRRNISRPPPSSTHGSGLVPLSCPDCFGVLRFERQGQPGYLQYRCQVEHRYSIGSLLEAKETHLERILWSAALSLTQLSYAYEDLLSELKKAKSTDRGRVQRRMTQLRKQCHTIRAMIEAEHAVDVQP